MQTMWNEHIGKEREEGGGGRGRETHLLDYQCLCALKGERSIELGGNGVVLGSLLYQFTGIET